MLPVPSLKSLHCLLSLQNFFFLTEVLKFSQPGPTVLPTLSGLLDRSLKVPYCMSNVSTVSVSAIPSGARTEIWQTTAATLSSSVKPGSCPSNKHQATVFLTVLNFLISILKIAVSLTCIQTIALVTIHFIYTSEYLSDTFAFKTQMNVC